MIQEEAWIPFSWHCPNCGDIVTGYKNQKGGIKVQCRHCRAVMIRTFKSKRLNTIDIYAPENEANIHMG